MTNSSTNPPCDDVTTVAQLRDEMRQFVQERDWDQFHSPKNLSMSAAIEAAELMEHFQWLTVEESRKLDAKAVGEVGEELADVLCYLLALANQLDIDVAATMLKKMDKNRIKYPADKFRGRYGHKDRQPPGGD